MSAQSLICASGRFQGGASDKFYQIRADLSWTFDGRTIVFSAEYRAHWGRTGTAGQLGKVQKRQDCFASLDLQITSEAQLKTFMGRLSEHILSVGETLIEGKFEKGYIRAGVSTGGAMENFGTVKETLRQAHTEARAVAEAAARASRHQELVAASADFVLDESAFGVGMGW